MKILLAQGMYCLVKDGEKITFVNMGSQHFYLLRYSMYNDANKMRPLTVTGLIKGIVDNFWHMNQMRFYRFLLWVGLMDKPQEGECVSMKCFKRLL